MSELGESPIEIEQDEEVEELKTTKVPKSPKTDRLTILRKKVSDLTEAERKQIIGDAQQGLDNDYYTVRLYHSRKPWLLYTL